MLPAKRLARKVNAGRSRSDKEIGAVPRLARR